MINLYLKAGKIRAALDLTNKYEILKTIRQTAYGENQDFKFKSLEIRARELKTAETRQLLEKLSKAAETIGDFSQAVEFEKAKTTFFKTSEETNLSLIRIEILQQKLFDKTANETNSFVVNETLVSDF